LLCPEFQFDFIYEYASPALKVELRQLSQDAESETEKLKQIVRFDDWLVSRRFYFVRKDIRTMRGQRFGRKDMGTVIAELRLIRRQQLERCFLSIILDRSETFHLENLMTAIMSDATITTSARIIKQVPGN
jgi:hypothetical protein